MIKHICVMRTKFSRTVGSWGIGNTPEEAEKLAKKYLYGEKEDKKERSYHEVNVPNGRTLWTYSTGTGVGWYTKPT